MKTLFSSFRTLCLLAVACMVSVNAMAYDVHDGIDQINVNPDFPIPSKILVVNKNATVGMCNIVSGVLIIAEGSTVTVSENFLSHEGVIYVYGTLDISNISNINNRPLSLSTIYVMQGGSIVGDFNNLGGNTITTNVDPATVGSPYKFDAQVPTPTNNFVGWPDYYQKIIYSADGTDSYPLNYYFEDEACTRPIANVEAWKATYSAIYKTAYNAGATDAYTAPTSPGIRMKVTKKDGKIYEFDTRDIESVDYIEETE